MKIESIEIQNYRVFQDTQVSDIPNMAGTGRVLGTGCRWVIIMALGKKAT